MRRTLMLLILCAALATPVIAGANDQTIPPKAHWTPTPLARWSVDVNQWASLLLDKGMITSQEYSQLTQPQPSSPLQPSHGREWTWDDIDRNPIRNTGGD
jgi:type II secretory pathway component PulL